MSLYRVAASGYAGHMSQLQKQDGESVNRKDVNSQSSRDAEQKPVRPPFFPSDYVSIEFSHMAVSSVCAVQQAVSCAAVSHQVAGQEI